MVAGSGGTKKSYELHLKSGGDQKDLDTRGHESNCGEIKVLIMLTVSI